jgi:hypothetical protein
MCPTTKTISSEANRSENNFGKQSKLQENDLGEQSELARKMCSLEKDF